VTPNCPGWWSKDGKLPEERKKGGEENKIANTKGEKSLTTPGERGEKGRRGAQPPFGTITNSKEGEAGDGELSTFIARNGGGGGKKGKRGKKFTRTCWRDS